MMGEEATRIIFKTVHQLKELFIYKVLYRTYYIQHHRTYVAYLISTRLNQTQPT